MFGCFNLVLKQRWEDQWWDVLEAAHPQAAQGWIYTLQPGLKIQSEEEAGGEAPESICAVRRLN